ncbi:regulator of chromosome condensation, putative [Ichthyophthirius multifiliis]|uniref:Regulator of chromosome condensation, putative n=1 Tax=Ichthyophthirius multifiliis TaxID=5932 RepID=G0QRI2_ICHMU|nr:regulator of chromosome condensation, putative [Ichthyophthirius multifiliis]EGR32173.1 regulator of chromosome condensation, putative [Ichthyophthirius multifiliis]|eukprot:XP_004035659.1 regulator of chromosome condensation, putative [Ichthyophthirius multifiliis]
MKYQKMYNFFKQKTNTKRLFTASLLVTSGFFAQSIFTDTPPQKTVYAWGYGNFGQLGLANENNQYSPQEVEKLSDRNIIKVKANKSVSMALSQDGKVYTWGKNKGGILGHYDITSFNMIQPELVEKLENIQIKQISCGPFHMAAISQDGELYTWGNKDHGKLGHEIQQKSNKVEIKRGNQNYDYAEGSMLPTKVQSLNGIKCKQVSCGGQFTVVLTENGEVYSFGNSMKGQLGYQSEETGNFQPKKIPDLQNIINIDCGQQFSAAVSSSGKVYTWGNNDHGQLGNNQSIYQARPNQVTGFGGNKIINISCGDNFIAALSNEGKLFTWGYGNDGQLGHSNRNDLYAPKQIEFKEKIIKVDCGGTHTAFLTQNNQLYLFGRGNEGQLGIGENIESEAAIRTTPKIVEFFKKMKVVDVTCGGEYTLAITE